MNAAEIQQKLDQAKTSEELHRFFHDMNAVKK